MVVEMSIRRGTWSEVDQAREERTVLGRSSSQRRLMKTLSSLSNVRFGLRLDQVKLLSIRGSSMRHMELMQSLKDSASANRKLSLFFS
jgi:hypothetical protein